MSNHRPPEIRLKRVLTPKQWAERPQKRNLRELFAQFYFTAVTVCALCETKSQQWQKPPKITTESSAFFKSSLKTLVCTMSRNNKSVLRGHKRENKPQSGTSRSSIHLADQQFYDSVTHFTSFLKSFQQTNSFCLWNIKILVSTICRTADFWMPLCCTPFTQHTRLVHMTSSKYVF